MMNAQLFCNLLEYVLRYWDLLGSGPHSIFADLVCNHCRFAERIIAAVCEAATMKSETVNTDALCILRLVGQRQPQLLVTQQSCIIHMIAGFPLLFRSYSGACHALCGFFEMSSIGCVERETPDKLVYCALLVKSLIASSSSLGL